MKRLFLLPALCLFAAGLHADAAPVSDPAAAAATAVWSDKLKLSGFMKVWAVAADNASRDYRAGSFVVRNLRVKVEAKPDERVKVVFMPEYAGSTVTPLTVLDAFITVSRGPLDLTAGQFYAPFGQDATTSAAKLWSVDYAMVYKAVKPGNAGNARELGLMASGKAGPLNLQAAALQGQGTNKASASGYVTDRNDYAAKAELAVPGSKLVLGAAAYSGWAGLAEPTLWTEVHARCDSSPLWPALFWKAEWLNRADTGRWGASANLGLKSGLYRTVLVYERVEDVAHALGKTVLGGGVSRELGSGLSVSLQAFGEASGASTSPTGGRSVAQLLAEF